jgi:hypothetical protein
MSLKEKFASTIPKIRDEWKDLNKKTKKPRLKLFIRKLHSIEFYVRCVIGMLSKKCPSNILIKFFD